MRAICLAQLLPASNEGFCVGDVLEGKGILFFMLHCSPDIFSKSNHQCTTADFTLTELSRDYYFHLSN
jgi:hypothetical protein